MKNIKLKAMILLLGASVIYGCQENVEPRNEALDNSLLTGTWHSGVRSVTVSIGEDDGQRTIYEDSTYLEDVGVVFDFGIEGVADSVAVYEINADDDGALDTTRVASGHYSFGSAENLEYTSPKMYFTVFDPAVPQGVEGNYRTTYTIENLLDNSMEVTWSFNNGRSRNSVKFEAQFSR
jgi:hypothetical protein